MELQRWVKFEWHSLNINMQQMNAPDATVMATPLFVTPSLCLTNAHVGEGIEVTRY